LGHEKRRKKKPLISKEILDLSDKRREMRGIRMQSEKNTGRYRAITKEIKKNSKQRKEEWIEERCREVESATGINTGKLFQTAIEICGAGTARLATVKNKEGKPLDNKAEIKQRWKQHYEELYNSGNPVDRTVLEELPVNNKQERMLNIMEGEIEAAIKNLKRKKAPGEDNITAEMIQAGGSCSVEMLHRLCNKFYNDKECPSDWSKAVIVPIHKKGIGRNAATIGQSAC